MIECRVHLCVERQPRSLTLPVVRMQHIEGATSLSNGSNPVRSDAYGTSVHQTGTNSIDSISNARTPFPYKHSCNAHYWHYNLLITNYDCGAMKAGLGRWLVTSVGSVQKLGFLSA